MKFLVLESHDPYLNLAIEEYLFLNSDEDVFMLWQNEPTVVIGKNQNAYGEIDRAFVKRNNIKVARRITGGGAVYHDLGNVNYTFISVATEQGIDFKRFCEPVISALKSIGVDAVLSGRNDIETSSGFKISGNAQYTKDGKVLHHGTLLFSSDLSMLSSSLRVDEEKLRTKAIKSTRSRVTNISDLINRDIDINEFISIISSFILSTYSLEKISPPTFEDVQSLYHKYSSEEWIYSNTDFLSSYIISKKKRYPFGTVDIRLGMKGDVISSAKIYGDFFGSLPIEELESLFCGANLSDISSVFVNVSVSDYIFGMTSDELIRLIIE